MTTDTVFALFSCTKAITATAALQLVEEGRLDLDAPAHSYVPEIGELKVLDGFDDDGTPGLRDPKREITTRMLLTHTAGFGYDAWNETYRRLGRNTGSRAPPPRPRAHSRHTVAVRPGRAVGVRHRLRLGRAGGGGHHGRTSRRGLRGPHLRPTGDHGHDLRARRPGCSRGFDHVPTTVPAPSG